MQIALFKQTLKPRLIVSSIRFSQKSTSPHCGYGACSSSGCNCQKYEGNGSTCANSGCGHGYDRHW